MEEKKDSLDLTIQKLNILSSSNIISYTYKQVIDRAIELLKEQNTVNHAKEVLCKNGWETMRFPEGTIGKWDNV